MPLGGHPATWWQVSDTGPLPSQGPLQFVLLEQTSILGLFASPSWPVRPQPTLSSVKLLNHYSLSPTTLLLTKACIPQAEKKGNELMSRQSTLMNPISQDHLTLQLGGLAH